jgi:hypothetical protein
LLAASDPLLDHSSRMTRMCSSLHLHWALMALRHDLIVLPCSATSLRPGPL